MRTNKLCALFAVGLCFACESEPQPKPAEAPKAAEAPKPAAKAEAVKPLSGEALAKHYVSCWGLYSKGDWNKFGECYAENAVSAFPDSGQPENKGRAAILANIKNERSAFPDTSGTPEIVLLNGRQVATIGFVSGTNSGPMKSPDGKEAPATNKKTAQRIFHAVTFDDKNQVSKETFSQDLGSLMFQLGISPGPGRAATGEPMADSPTIVVAKNDDKEKANVELVKKLTEAFSKEDLKTVEASMADDIVESDQAAPADLKGKKAVLDNCKMYMGALGDMKQECSTWGAGDYVVSSCQVSAVNDGDLGKVKKTGKTINLNMVEISKVADGKVSQLWRFYNGMAFAKQLGLIPDEPPATAKAEEGAAGAAKTAEAAPAAGASKALAPAAAPAAAPAKVQPAAAKP